MRRKGIEPGPAPAPVPAPPPSYADQLGLKTMHELLGCDLKTLAELMELAMASKPPGDGPA
jgi:hypothetical protein